MKQLFDLFIENNLISKKGDKLLIVSLQLLGWNIITLKQ